MLRLLPTSIFLTSLTLLLAACSQSQAGEEVLEKPRVGLFTSLPIYWGEGGLSAILDGSDRKDWVRALIETRFEIEPLDTLAEECRRLGGTWLSDRLSDPTPYIRAIAMPNMSATAQVMRFDMAGIAVSQGSACSSGTMKTSRVLEAMQVQPEIAANTIRVSTGWNTSREEVERFCEVWLDLAGA